MAHEGLPLITDEVGRRTEQPEIPISQSLSGSMCSLIFHHICYNIFGEVIFKTSTFWITGSSLRGTVSSIEVKSTCNNSPGPLQVKGFIGTTGGAASYFLQGPHFLMRFLRSQVMLGHQKHSCMRVVERC